MLFVSFTHKTMGRNFQIIVMGFKGDRMEVDVGRDSDEFERFTVLDLKRKIFSRFAEEEENIPEDRIRLIFNQEHLDDDDKLLKDYGIQHMSMVQMVLMVDGGGGDPPKGSMGDRDHKNLSMERLNDFNEFPK